MTLVLFLSILNAFLAGFHGSAAVVATVISSRALTPRVALFWAAAAAWLGPILLGTAVANTISQQLIFPTALSLEVLACGLVAAASWITVTWFVGIPCSASQALMGGLFGSAVSNVGWAALQPVGFAKTLLGLFLSPPLGLLAGLLIMQVVLHLFQSATPRINVLFRQFQLITTLGLALTVGSNDAQKFMGLMVLALVLAGQHTDFQVPLWVLLASATAFALGMLSGGYRLIKTIGGRIFTLRPVHSLSAQLAAGMVILVANLTGLPVSSTQVVSTSVFGVGAAERASKVRWQVAREMLSTWALTIPLTAALAGLLLWLWKGNGL